MTLFEHLIEKHSRAALVPKEVSKQFWEEQSQNWPADMRQTMFKEGFDPQNPDREAGTLMSFIDSLSDMESSGNPHN